VRAGGSGRVLRTRTTLCPWSLSTAIGSSSPRRAAPLCATTSTTSSTIGASSPCTWRLNDVPCLRSMVLLLMRAECEAWEELCCRQPRQPAARSQPREIDAQADVCNWCSNEWRSRAGYGREPQGAELVGNRRRWRGCRPAPGYCTCSGVRPRSDPSSGFISSKVPRRTASTLSSQSAAIGCGRSHGEGRCARSATERRRWRAGTRRSASSTSGLFTRPLQAKTRCVVVQWRCHAVNRGWVNSFSGQAWCFGDTFCGVWQVSHVTRRTQWMSVLDLRHAWLHC